MIISTNTSHITYTIYKTGKILLETFYLLETLNNNKNFFKRTLQTLGRDYTVALESVNNIAAHLESALKRKPDTDTSGRDKQRARERGVQKTVATGCQNPVSVFVLFEGLTQMVRQESD